LITSLFLLFFFLLLLFLFLLWWLFFVLWLFLVRLRVNAFTNLHGRVLHSIEGLSDSLWILSGDGLIQRSDVTINLIFNVLRDLITVLLKLLLSVIDSLIGLIL
jgi:hypothetical protein